MSVIHNGLQNLRPVNTTNFLSARARNYGYYPLIKGNEFPDFQLPVENRIAQKQPPLSITNGTHLSIEDITGGYRPLVITFFNAVNNTAIHIKNLKGLQADIHVMGGRLLVLTSLQSGQLRKALKNIEEITVFYDKENVIAELFGLYDVANPLWQWLPGVDNDISLPAFYVISAEKQIVFHYIDYALRLHTNNNYSTHPFVRDLLTSVYNAAQQHNYQPIQYRSVS